MIDIGRIHCTSSLHDCCGVVFEYEGRFLRALLPRGAELFERLNQNGWMESLAEKGLSRMKPVELHVPGYKGVIELESHRPVIPPFLWTTGMLTEAGLVICRLTQELLTQGLVIWDLKGMTNMTFSAVRGPLLLDIGAIYTTQELEDQILTTSVRSLFDQIVSSFYLPLWLTYGPFRDHRISKRLVAYQRAGEQGFAFTTSLMRRLMLGHRFVPGLLRARNLLCSRQYQRFFELLRKKIGEWHERSCTQLRLEDPGPASGKVKENRNAALISALKEILGRMDGKVIFDLFPHEGIGLSLAEGTKARVYMVTENVDEADRFYAWRRQNGKPVLPVLCDIWDRSFQSVCLLRNICDIAFVLPHVVQAAVKSRVPMDHLGRVLSTLTNDVAVVGVDEKGKETAFPTFVSNPKPEGGGASFVLNSLGKHFREREIVRNSKLPNTSLLVFRK